jgi:hypothetical protein
MSKQIISLQKQNDGIHTSLFNKGICFERIVISDNASDDEKLKLLQDENFKLKDVLKEFNDLYGPPAQVKKSKSQPVSTQTQKQTQTTKPKVSDDVNSDEEDFSEPVKKFDCITNMEYLKRAFFNGNYEEFESEVKKNNFPMFEANYKYSSDKDNCPEFAAKNLLCGFVRNLEDYRKYLIVCFRCHKVNSDDEPTRYEYKSYWIVNSLVSVEEIIGSNHEDFEWNNITPDKVDSFLKEIRKSYNSPLDEKYLH